MGYSLWGCRVGHMTVTKLSLLIKVSMVILTSCLLKTSILLKSLQPRVSVEHVLRPVHRYGLFLKIFSIPLLFLG